MNQAFYQSASYVPAGGVRAEKKRRQEEWDEYQRHQQVQRASMDSVSEDAQLHTPATRRRAESHPQRYSSSGSRSSMDAAYAAPSYDANHSRRYSNTECGGSRLSPQSSPFQAPGEIRRLSGNFNAPTEVELEREKEQRKTLKGVERVRSRFKAWVNA